MRHFSIVSMFAIGMPAFSSAVSLVAVGRQVSSSSSSSSTTPTEVPVQPIATYIPPAAPSLAPVTRVFSYSGGGFENLAFRSNGQVLATIAFPEPLLFYVDPLQIRPGVILHNFTALQNTVGITELAQDHFYVHGKGKDGISTVYLVDMRESIILPNGTIAIPPKIEEVGRIPKALALNGMTSRRRPDNFVLIADTLLGGVWRFFIESGKHELVIKDPSMAGPANKTDFAAFGINGIRIQNSTLFYCNSGAQAFYKMRVSFPPVSGPFNRKKSEGKALLIDDRHQIHSNGSSAGEAKLITSDIACDDFALDRWGFAYVASPRNALIRLDTRTGAQLVVAGAFNQSSSNIISASSARFGAGDSDHASVYITTNGGAFVGAPPDSQGISRVDVGDIAQISSGSVCF